MQKTILLRAYLTHTNNVYTITAGYMTCVQMLDFKFKFCMIVIHLRLTVYALSVYKRLILLLKTFMLLLYLVKGRWNHWSQFRGKDFFSQSSPLLLQRQVELDIPCIFQFSASKPSSTMSPLFFISCPSPKYRSTIHKGCIKQAYNRLDRFQWQNDRRQPHLVSMTHDFLTLMPRYLPSWYAESTLWGATCTFNMLSTVKSMHVSNLRYISNKRQCLCPC